MKNSLTTGTQAFAYFPHDENSTYGQIDYLREQRSKAPKRRPGDIFTFIGTIIGIIIALLLSLRTANIFLIALCAVGGGIIGALIGSVIGKVYVKRKKEKEKYGGNLTA